MKKLEDYNWANHMPEGGTHPQSEWDTRQPDQPMFDIMGENRDAPEGVFIDDYHRGRYVAVDTVEEAERVVLLLMADYARETK